MLIIPALRWLIQGESGYNQVHPHTIKFNAVWNIYDPVLKGEKENNLRRAAPAVE